MTTHYLDDSSTHNFWDNSFPPRIHIENGDTVVFECREGTGGLITQDSRSEDISKIDRSHLHALTGPVYVNGAKPGDALEIEVCKFEHKGWGYTHTTVNGLLSEDFPTPYLHQWRIEGNNCIFKENPLVKIPLEPFCGIIGVAPSEKGRIITIPPRRNGGNVDSPGITAGAKVWLPVLAPGALLSIGDCHATQGYGEVCGTAVECPMTVMLRINVNKNKKISELQYEKPISSVEKQNSRYYVTTAHGPDLYQNAQNAVRYMIEYLCAKYGLEREEAYILCSVVVDLKINEIVNKPNFIVSATLPLDIFSNFPEDERM
jgi:acetamidase/formamidase